MQKALRVNWGGAKRPLGIIRIESGLETFNTTQGTPSASQKYSLAGLRLVDIISIEAPSGWELSLDDANWDNPISVPAEFDGDVWIRLSGEVAGLFEGSIVTHESERALRKRLLVSGSVIEVVATPIISTGLAALNYDDEVTITCATPGATIYYTTDDSTPSAADTVYTGAIVVAEGMTRIKAIAVKGGFNSEVAASGAVLVPVGTIVSATLGGQELEAVEDGDDYVWIFNTTTPGTTASGTFEASAELAVEMLIVGGGGSGGGRMGGGGGGGGVLELRGDDAVSVPGGTELALQIGKGGARTSAGGNGNKGDDTTVIGGEISLTAHGGGAGGNYAGTKAGGNGGSGGGGSWSDGAGGTATRGTSGAVGNNGGAGAANTVQGGGGGAAGAGKAGGVGTPQGVGGAGVQSDITGVNVYYGAGGGGCGSSTYQPAAGAGNEGGRGAQTGTTTSGENAAPENRGHGGGGGSETNGYRVGGKGSDGLIVIRCPKAGVTLGGQLPRLVTENGDPIIYEENKYVSWGA